MIKNIYKMEYLAKQSLMSNKSYTNGDALAMALQHALDNGVSLKDFVKRTLKSNNK